MKKIYLRILIGAAAVLAVALIVTAVCGVFPFTREKRPAAAGLIESVSPTGTCGVHENQIVQVNVRAASDCAVFVQLGATRVDAVAVGLPADGLTTFCAILTMPQSRQEIESLGFLRVSAKRGDESESMQAAQIVFQAMTTTTAAPTEDTDDIEIENFVAPSEPAQTPTESTTAPITQPAAASSVIPAGAQACMVRPFSVDTWPAQSGDDTFFPSSTPLVNGTIDYIVGTTQMFNTEKQTMRDYYILASGRKVRTDAVDLLATQPAGDNRMEVRSVSAQGGTLKIQVQTAWSVPYDFSFAPQNYYAANGTRFNVSDFTADRIQFTFHYTTAATGAIDCSGSDVVSAAGWTVDAEKRTAALTFSLRMPGRYYGYAIQRDSQNSFILTIQNHPKSLAGAVIVLDAGHGGRDPGALGYGGAVYESQLNFALAVATKSALEQRGAQVIMTRTDDVVCSLDERRVFAAQYHPDVYLSIHCNASESKAHFGTSVYYYRPMSQPLASAIYTRLLALFQNDFYAAEPDRRAGAGEGTRFYPFSLTRVEECPSVLIETGYVTNDKECAVLLNAGNRDKIAAAICDGVTAFFAR